MAFVLNALKTVRNNWKKSVFFTGVFVYGVDYAAGKYEDSLVRKAYCLEAKTYGDVLHRTGDKLKKVTVFLNPAAKNGKGKSFFEANVAPIFHLAGFEVRVVRTEYEGQAKQYMEAVEEASDNQAIVVAGGDGTLAEVVTGLMRRPDADKYAKIPIGFIPMGYSNTVAQSLFHRGRSDAQWQVEAAMAVVKGLTQHQDVMQIGDEERKVYVLSKLEKGILTDIKNRKQKNWYMGPMKHRWAYIRESLRNWPRAVDGELRYKVPCNGCAKCYVPPPEIQWKWWHIFLPPQRQEVKDFSNVINEKCGEVYIEPVETMQLNIVPTRDENNVSAVAVSTTPKEMSRLEFIKQGWGYESKKREEVIDKKQVVVGEMVFIPKMQEGKEEFYLIDNEKFELMPVEVKVQRDRLMMFCSQPEKRFIEIDPKEYEFLRNPMKLVQKS